MNPVQKIAQLPTGVKIGGGALGAAGVGGGVLAFTQGSLFPYLVGLAVITLMGVIGWFALRAWERAKKRAAAKRFAEDIDDGLGEAEGLNKAAEEELKNRLLEGVRLYEKSGTSVYESPWFVLVGPPSAGKTVLLQKCGLVDREKMLQGTGGTKGMNWWFIDADLGGDDPLHAVVLDMAGAVFMDSRQEGRWNTFLEFLRKNRPYEPLNGVLLVVSVEDLLGKPAEKLAEEGATIRAQLEKIREKLDVRFPVWVVVTKCDRIDGFKEFFDTIKDPAAQAQIFGWSKPGKVDGSFNPKMVESEVQGIIERLRRYRMRSLADMVIGDQRAERQSDLADTMFTLPAAFTELGTALQRYLETVFARKKVAIAPPFFRGIYFTSSERKGAAISDWLSKTGGQFREEEWPDRSFFNKHLFTEKIFREVNLVTAAENVDKMQRTRRVAGYVAASACAAVLIIASAASYFTLQRNFVGIAGYYSTLAEDDGGTPRVDRFIAAAAAGKPTKDLAAMGLSGRDGSDAASLGEVLEASQAWASESTGTGFLVRTLYFLPQVVFGSVEQSDTRTQVHRRLTREAVVRPLVERSLATMARAETWTVDSPRDLERFSTAVAALEQIARLGVRTQNVDPDKADTGLIKPDADLRRVLELEPLIKLLAAAPAGEVSADALSKPWWLTVDAKELARLQAAVDGVPGSKSKDGAVSVGLPAGFTRDDLASMADVFTRESGGLQTALETFRKSLDAQAKGDAGILKILAELKDKHADAESILGTLNTRTADNRATDDEGRYTQFATFWQEKASNLTDIAGQCRVLIERLGVESDGLRKQLRDIEKAQAQAHERVRAVVAPGKDKDPAAARERTPMNLWDVALGVELKTFDDAVGELDLPANARDPWLQMLTSVGDKPAADGPAKAQRRVLDVLAEAAGQIGVALAKGAGAWVENWPQDQKDALGLISVKPADAFADLRALRESITAARTQLGADALDQPKNAQTFAIDPSFSETTIAAAMDLADRRVRGVGLARLVEQPAFSDAIAAADAGRRANSQMLGALAAGLKPLDVQGALPLAKLSAESRPVPADRRAAVLGLIDRLSAALPAASTSGQPARPRGEDDAPPIIDATTRKALPKLTTALQADRDDLLAYWTTGITTDLSVPTGQGAPTLDQIAAALKSIDADKACTLLADIAQERASTGAAAAPGVNWDAFSTAQAEATRKRVTDWLKATTRQLEERASDPAELQRRLLSAGREQLLYDPMLVDGLPYFGSLAEALLNAVGPELQNAYARQCSEVQKAKGFPLFADAQSVIPEGDVKTWYDTLKAAASTTPAATDAPRTRTGATGVAAALDRLAAIKPEGGCAVPPSALQLAKILSDGFTLKISPAGGDDFAAQNVAPRLDVILGDQKIKAFGDFKNQGQGDFTLEVPAKDPIKLVFRDESGGKTLTIEFANRWHLICMLASDAATPVGPNAWDVSIKDLARHPHLRFQAAGESGQVSLRLRVEAVGVQGTLPPFNAWPRLSSSN